MLLLCVKPQFFYTLRNLNPFVEFESSCRYFFLCQSDLLIISIHHLCRSVQGVFFLYDRMVIGAVTAGLYRRPGLARFLPHRQPPDVNHPVFDGAAAAAVMHNERLASEEPSRSRSRSTTPTASVAAKFSRRVSRSRHNDEDGKDSSTTPPPPRERRPRRKY